MRLHPRTRVTRAAASITVVASVATCGLASVALPAQASARDHPARAVAADGPDAQRVETSVEQTKVPDTSEPRTAARSRQKAGPGRQPVVAKLSKTRTRDFGVVGLTWEPGFDSAGATAQIRARVDDHWTAWQSLGIEPSEDEGGRAGTEPAWVGEADGIAARVTSPTGKEPQDLRVATIDGGEGLAEPTTSAALGPATVGAVQAEPALATADMSATVQASTLSKPSWVTRKQWGVNKRYESHCSEPQEASSAKGVVLHHTAGSNNYSRAEAPGIVRAIHLYHTKARNWCDIGYNFLVDKYGTIYVGRRGGPKHQIRGAHAGNFDVNLYTTGISMLGNFDKVRPSTALKNAVVRLTAWRLSYFDRGARGRIAFGGGTIKRISGHRDVYLSGIRPATATACPGRYAYQWLNENGGLRDRVDAKLDTPSSGGSRLTGAMGDAYERYARWLGDQRGDVHKGVTKGILFANFVNGRIYEFGGKAYATWGAIDHKYSRLHAAGGVLGRPRGSVHGGVTPGISFVNFVNGRIYEFGGKAYATWGAIDHKYTRLHAAGGKLGHPTRSTYPTDHGLRADFAHGSITWNKNTHKTAVHYN